MICIYWWFSPHGRRTDRLAGSQALTALLYTMVSFWKRVGLFPVGWFCQTAISLRPVELPRHKSIIFFSLEMPSLLPMDRQILVCTYVRTDGQRCKEGSAAWLVRGTAGGKPQNAFLYGRSLLSCQSMSGKENTHLINHPFANELNIRLLNTNNLSQTTNILADILLNWFRRQGSQVFDEFEVPSLI